MATPRIIVSTPMPEAAARRAAAEFGAVLSQEGSRPTDALLKALDALPTVEGVLISSKNKFDAAAVAALPPRIKGLSTISVGFDHIDLKAAAQRGLIVTNTPEVLTEATADMTMLLMLGACRRAGEYAAMMRAGWPKRLELNEMLGIQVSGRTVGIVGMGRIGRAVAQRARGFGMTILYHDVVRLPVELEQGATFYPRLADMLPRCEIITIHATGGGNTGNLLNRETLAQLPRGAVVINAARGSHIDEDALIEALTSGQVAAAGLDVFRKEPDFDKRFLDLSNVFLTPHVASATVETRNAMALRALDNIAAVLSGGTPRDRVTA